jgi:hypothetical protein
MPPTPKRNAERRRRNKGSQADVVHRAETVSAPPPPPGLHPAALRWYEALQQSGQSEYFEPSDWAAALYVAEAMTQNLNASRFSAQLFGVVWSAMDDLLTTEQARRRARIEVQRELGDVQPERPGITAIAEYRKALGG